MAPSRLQVFLLFLFLACFCTGQSLDPVEDHCARWHHQSTIKDGFLYIDGGVETFRYDNGKILGYNQELLRIDMRDSWNWKTNMSSLTIRKTQNEQTGSNPRSLVRGALFQGPSNDSKIYTYGGTTFLGNTSFPGWAGQDPDTYSLWSYSTSTQSWDQYDVTKGSPRRPNYGASAEAPALGLAFYLNGQVDDGSSSATSSMKNATEYLNGMIVLNTVDQSARNVSTTSLGNPRVAGGLQFIEGVGIHGALVAIGGSQRSNAGAELVAFDHVELCDDFTENSTWFRQATTGDIPEPRSDFCVVTASAPDNSSHNIYLYGGIDATASNNMTTYDDIYALSLPSFVWTRIYGPGQSPRWGHTCHLVGSRQMLTVGGTIDESVYDIETIAQHVNTSSLSCDWEYKGVAIYDMTSLKWGSVFNAYEPAYQVPPAIASAIGGNENGSATMTAPANGFAEAAVSAMFAPRTTALANATAVPDDSPESGRSNTGLVVGAVVGGVVGLCVFLGVALFILHRMKKAKREADEITGQQRRAGDLATPYAELMDDASRYELDNRNRTPEMAVGPSAQELDAEAEPAELVDNNTTPVELPVGRAR